MKISIDREACCAADDQAGSLDMQLDIPDSFTLASLAEKIREARFLQYSATHGKLYGKAAGRALLSISSEFHGDGQVVYFVDKNTTAKAAVPDGRLRFTFDT